METENLDIKFISKFRWRYRVVANDNTNKSWSEWQMIDDITSSGDIHLLDTHIFDPVNQWDHLFQFYMNISSDGKYCAKIQSNHGCNIVGIRKNEGLTSQVVYDWFERSRAIILEVHKYNGIPPTTQFEWRYIPEDREFTNSDKWIQTTDFGNDPQNIALDRFTQAGLLKLNVLIEQGIYCAKLSWHHTDGHFLSGSDNPISEVNGISKSYLNCNGQPFNLQVRVKK